MQLGFVSAILADQTLEQVFAFAAQEGFGCVELMCWPPGKAERRYAGVTHVDVTDLTDAKADEILALSRRHGVAISGLGYYPNPLDPDPAAREFIAQHLKTVMQAARRLGVGVVNTFIGRNPAEPIEKQWPLVKSVWTDLMRHAEDLGIRVGIENCPMIFSLDEWPGGKNLAISPATWERLFAEVPSANLGLNFDPSHLVWLGIDYCRAVRDFGQRFVHVHAKDMRIDQDKLYRVGNMGLGWSIPKIPGLGEVNWSAFFAELTNVGYNGPVCIEVEDRAFEGSLADRQRSLRVSKRYLEAYVG
jgi:sugar phosphate isomerase/epimerase